MIQQKSAIVCLLILVMKRCDRNGYGKFEMLIYFQLNTLVYVKNTSHFNRLSDCVLIRSVIVTRCVGWRTLLLGFNRGNFIA